MSFLRKHKSLFMCSVIAFLVAVLVACSSDAETGAEESDNEETVNDEKYTLRIAYTVTEDHASHIAWTEIMDEVENKSEGRLQLEVYPNGSLYSSDREAVEAVQMGNVEMTEIASSTLATFNPKFAVFDLPFLFMSREAAYEAQDGELGEVLNDELPEMNLIGLGYGENGFRHFLNNKHPIEKPEDFEGLKIRVLESKIFEDIFNTLGANASPLAFGELYTALQQGVFDGMDNPISLVHSMKFYEVQEYMTLSGYSYAPTITVINKDVFEEMPSDLQDVLRESVEIFSNRQRELTVQQDEEKLEELEKTMEINELTPEQKEEFVKALEPIYEKYRDEIGGDLIDLARKAND